MTTHYHPKHGVKYLTSHVALTLENPDPKLHSPNATPLCREVVNTISIPLEQGDGTFRFVDFDKDHLVELLAYARSIEEREPVYTKPDLTREDIQATLVNLQQARWIANPVEHFNKNFTQNEKPF